MLFIILILQFTLSWALKCYRCPNSAEVILKEPYPACFINASIPGSKQYCDEWLTKCVIEYICKLYIIHCVILGLVIRVGSIFKTLQFATPRKTLDVGVPQDITYQI